MNTGRKPRIGWGKWLEEAKEYQRTHGDLLVPFEYVTPSGLRLGRWIQRQRAAYEGKGGLMTADRIADLNAVGMVWEREHHTPWEEMYVLAQQYFQEYGNLRVPHDYRADDGKNLGLWIKHQRDKYNGAAGSELTRDQTERLEAIGMCWRVYGPPSTWMEWFEEARHFYRRYGHLNVHTRYITPSGRKLGLWVKSQRYKGREGLEPGQAELLDSVGMNWQVKERTEWEVWYSLAEEYYLEHGSLPASKNYVTPEGKKLGVWLSVQRERYSQKGKKKLTQEQTSLLEELGMSWQPCEDRWRQMFALAQDFYREHGHLRVPQGYVLPTGEKLGRWISLQRQAYHGTASVSLTPERKRLLEGIGMCWEPYSEAWEKMYARARQYREEYGDLMVPQEYVTPEGERLGVWVTNQRMKYRKQGKQCLSEDQVRRLERLGMVWDPSELREKEWDFMYGLVKDYWLSHGAYPLDGSLISPGGKSLRGWYYQQRRDLKKEGGRMSARRKRLLEKIGITAGGGDPEEKATA